MPISRDQFKRGEDAITYQLRNIFMENPEKAFAYEELVDKLNIPKTSKGTLNFLMILFGLQLSRLIETKTIDNVLYYALRTEEIE